MKWELSSPMINKILAADLVNPRPYPPIGIDVHTEYNAHYGAVIVFGDAERAKLIIRAVNAYEEHEAFVSLVADMTIDGECPDCHSEDFSKAANAKCEFHREFEMTSDDAFETINQLIRKARNIRKEQQGQEPDKCDRCSAILKPKDYDGGRCTNCGTMLLPKSERDGLASVRSG